MSRNRHHPTERPGIHTWVLFLSAAWPAEPRGQFESCRRAALLSVSRLNLRHMTLILAMSAPNAICMSVDYRVTAANDGRELDPYAVKSLVIRTSFEPGGPIALIAYTGLAELWGRMPMGRWLRETLRGQSQPFDDLMQHLLSQLNRKIASFNQVLVINVLVVNGPNGEERYWGGFSNTRDLQNAEPKFEYILDRIGDQDVFGSGSGAQAVIDGGYVKTMQEHVANPDHSPTDHMNLLAKVNREVAEADLNGPVSPYCFVTCVGSEDNWAPAMRVFHEPGETPPDFHMPMIACGIDVSNPAEQIHRAAESRTHPRLDEDQIRRNLDRRP